MSKFIVVSVHRDRYCWPKLTIFVEARCKTASAAQAYVVKQVMAAYEKRTGRRYVSCRVKDFQVVDEVGLRRLKAAAKASATIRRKRAAKKAAATRAKNREATRVRSYGSYYVN